MHRCNNVVIACKGFIGRDRICKRQPQPIFDLSAGVEVTFTKVVFSLAFALFIFGSYDSLLFLRVIPR